MEGHSSSASKWKARQEKGLSHSRTYLHTFSVLNCEPQCFDDLKFETIPLPMMLKWCTSPILSSCDLKLGRATATLAQISEALWPERCPFSFSYFTTSL
jgi:hypothetical protein